MSEREAVVFAYSNLVKAIFGERDLLPIGEKEIQIANQVLDSLRSNCPRGPEVVRMRFGLYPGSRELTREEIGAMFDMTRERVRQIEIKAIRMLRHPSRSKRIRHVVID